LKEHLTTLPEAAPVEVPLLSIATYDYVTTEVIGQSFERREMRVVSLCRGGCGRKPAVWIDAGNSSPSMLVVMLGKCGLVRLKADLFLIRVVENIKQVNSQGGSVPLLGTQLTQ
jgi:hypothetical protein